MQFTSRKVSLRAGVGTAFTLCTCGERAFYVVWALPAFYTVTSSEPTGLRGFVYFTVVNCMFSSSISYCVWFAVVCMLLQAQLLYIALVVHYSVTYSALLRFTYVLTAVRVLFV